MLLLACHRRDNDHACAVAEGDYAVTYPHGYKGSREQEEGGRDELACFASVRQDGLAARLRDRRLSVGV